MPKPKHPITNIQNSIRKSIEGKVNFLTKQNNHERNPPRPREGSINQDARSQNQGTSTRYDEKEFRAQTPPELRGPEQALAETKNDKEQP